jgi:hypothetical protein
VLRSYRNLSDEERIDYEKVLAIKRTVRAEADRLRALTRGRKSITQQERDALWPLIHAIEADKVDLDEVLREIRRE